MFRITTTDGVTLGYTETIRYIKINPRNGCFNACDKKDAIGVAYKSNPYNLLGHSDIADVPTVFVTEFDGGSELRRLEQENSSLKTHLAETDEAAIELYEANIHLEEANAEQDEAIIEIYEMIGESTNG